MINTRWYVLHAYSGYEKKVADSIVEQAEKLGISDQIEEVSVPTQNIVEVKRGVRVNSERKIFPGYILIKMNLNGDFIARPVRVWLLGRTLNLLEQLPIPSRSLLLPLYGVRPHYPVPRPHQYFIAASAVSQPYALFIL